MVYSLSVHNFLFLTGNSKVKTPKTIITVMGITHLSLSLFSPFFFYSIPSFLFSLHSLLYRVLYTFLFLSSFFYLPLSFLFSFGHVRWKNIQDLNGTFTKLLLTETSQYSVLSLIKFLDQLGVRTRRIHYTDSIPHTLQQQSPSQRQSRTSYECIEKTEEIRRADLMIINRIVTIVCSLYNYYIGQSPSS